MQRARCTFSALLMLAITGCQNHTYVYSPTGTQPQTHAAMIAPPQAKLPPTPPPKKEPKLENFQLEESALPSTLSEIIDLALTHNPKTHLSWQRVRKARARLGQAQSGYFPALNLSGGINRSKSPSPLTESSYYQSLYQASLEMSYTLLDFGQRKWQNRSANRLLASAKYMHEQTFQNVIQQVKTDYFDLIYQRAQTCAYEEDVKSAKLAFQIAEAKYEGGVGDRSDMAVAKTQYCLAISKLAEKRYHVRTAQSRLNADIGFPFESSLNLNGFEESPDLNRDIRSASELVELAMRKRPDLKSLRKKVEAERADLNYQKASAGPKLRARASVGESYTSITNSPYMADSTYEAGIELTFPLFSGFYYRNKAKESQAKLRAAQASLEEKEIEVIRGILDAQNGVASAAERLQSTKAFLDAALSSYEITLAKYKAGTAPLLNLSQAAADLALARSSYIESKRDWYVFLTDLGYATGILSAQMLDEMPIDLIEKPKLEGVVKK